MTPSKIQGKLVLVWHDLPGPARVLNAWCTVRQAAPPVPCKAPQPAPPHGLSATPRAAHHAHQAKTLQDAIASGKGAKRSRGEAGSDGGAGEAGAGRPASKALRHSSVYEVGEAKDWVVAPPLRQQQQQQQQTHDQQQREQQQEQQEQQQQQASVLPGDASVWEHKAPEAAATLEEEMDSYLDAMFV